MQNYFFKYLNVCSILLFSNIFACEYKENPNQSTMQPKQDKPRKTITRSLADTQQSVAEVSLQTILNNNPQLLHINEQCEISVYSFEEHNYGIEVTYELKTDLKTWGWNRVTVRSATIAQKELNALGWKF